MDPRDSRADTLPGAWLITGTATLIGVALGVLYVWSVVRAAIPAEWGWSQSDMALPYAVACMVFALTMVPAGRLQDALGPRITASVGGVFAGLGCVVAGLAEASLAGFVLGFGVLTGAGIGLGYAATTPVAVKWHPARRSGLVAGIVVAGSGLAPVVVAPLASWLLWRFGANPLGGLHSVSATLITLGVMIAVVVVALAQRLRNPPTGALAANQAAGQDVSWREMLSGRTFYLLWFMYFAGAAAGLTFIGVAQSLGTRSLGGLAFVAVVVLALGNAAGRVVAGTISDRLGRHWTLLGFYLLQCVVVATLYATRAAGSGSLLLVILFVLGGSYGANLAVFPSLAKDCYGLAGFGLNYGLLFTAWGTAGLSMPWLAGRLADATGSDGWSYLLVDVLLALAAVAAFTTRRRPVTQRAGVGAVAALS